MVVQEKKPQVNRQTCPLDINRNSLETLQKASYEVWFGVWNTKVKLHGLYLVDAAKEFLAEIKIDGLMECDHSTAQLHR